MAPKFSTPRKVVNVTLTADVNGNRYGVSDADIRSAVADSLRRLARENGVTVDAIEVTVADGPRTVTMTEDEYNALRGDSASTATE